MVVPVSNTAIVASLSAAAVIGLITYLLKRKNREWKRVAVVSKLYIYPLKSGRGVAIENMDCHEYGAENSINGMSDRNFMLIDKNGDKMSGTRFPKLTLVQTTLLANGDYRLSAEGMQDLDFPVPKPDDATTKVM